MATKSNDKSKTPRRSQPAAAASQQLEKPSFLPARVRNDLVGVIIAVVAIVLLVIVLLPGDAIGSKLISTGIHLLVGIGAMILPFLLLGWSATFFLRQRLTAQPLRLIIGLGLIYLAIIAIAATLTPGAGSDASLIFLPDYLSSSGGYLGGAIAWACLSLIGIIATIVLLIGMIIAGLVLIGLSISRIIENLTGRIAKQRQDRQADEAALNAKALGAYQMGPGQDGEQAASAKNGAARNPAGSIPLTRLMSGKNNKYRDDLPSSFEQDGQGVLPLEATADLGATRRFNKLKSDNQNNSEENENDVSPDAPTIAKAKKAGTRKNTSNKKTAGEQHSGLMLESFELPNPQVLRVSREIATTKAGAAELRSTAARLQATFEEFGVEGQVIGWISGPTVTLYKVALGEGVRLNRITNLQNDIQLSLAAEAIRIVAPIPGTSLVGIEIPNGTRNTVLLGDVLFNAQPGPLQLAIGKDVEGDSITADLAAMPHLLIGGSTGSGKSVAINAMIMSILMRATPEEVRMILIDPKMVELSLYNGIPHLYVPVVTDAHQAAGALNWAVAEMERRLKIFGKHGVKNIKQFNARVAEELSKLAAQDDCKSGNTNQPGSEADTANSYDAQEDANAAPTSKDLAVEQDELRATMPYILIVIDELADLMMVAGKDVETSISRLAQLARAAGLHLIVATQRPSSTVITGLIKANIVNRIAFTVATGIDSRVILDTNGAEDLIGMGDLLFSRPEYSKPSRIQGCLVSEPEIETVVAFLRSQGEPDYRQDILETRTSGSTGSSSDEPLGEDDPLLWEAAEIVVTTGFGSTSTLQRRLKVGYARAGRIMDMLEAKGIVGPPNGSKPRDVIIDDVLDLETLKAYERYD